MYGIYDGGQVIAQFAAPLTVRSNVPVFQSDTLSLRRFTTKRAAQRWEIESNLEPLTFGAQALFAHLVQKGLHDTLQVIVPQNYGVIKARTATVSPVTATGSLGATQVTVDGNTGLIPKGTFLKFANGGKVYMATSDLTGNGVLNIYPQLKVAVSGTNMYHLDDVVMTCYYDVGTVQGMAYTDGIMMDVGSVKLVEAL